MPGALPDHQAYRQLVGAVLIDNRLLEELSVAMADASICGLGQAAPNPIRCVAKHFAHEVTP